MDDKILLKQTIFFNDNKFFSSDRNRHSFQYERKKIVFDTFMTNTEIPNN